jgi:N-methylhydantoinase B/oxoprolinase/acetone carboxylase alpha subunit
MRDAVPEPLELRSILADLFDDALASYRTAVRLPWQSTAKAAILDATGAPIALSAVGAAASLAASVAGVRAFFGDAWNAGDAAVTNDPDLGSANACEMTVVVPGFAGKGAPRFWVAFRAGVPDFGGWEIGGFSPQAVDRWAEGARIEPAKIVIAGARRREVADLLALNSRTPRTTLRCVLAMVDGAERVARGLLDRNMPIGGRDWSEAVAAMTYGEMALIDRAFARLSRKATGRAEVDSPLADARPGPVGVTVDRSGDRLTAKIDAPAVSHRPINLGRQGAADCIIAALVSGFGLGALSTGAILRRVAVEVAEPSLAAAPLPATVGMGRETTGRALARATLDALRAAGIEPGLGAWDAACRTELGDALDRSSGKVTAERAKEIRTRELEEARS